MDNKEYIERGALLKTPPFTKFGGESSAYTEGYLDCANEARNAVNDAPAADVVEVRHGEWVAKDLIVRSPFARNHYCSVCQYEPIETKSYCPECGAKMGERKDIP